MKGTHRIFSAHAASVAVALVVLSCASSVQATTYVVTETADDADLGDNGNCTLREAILAANRDVAVDGCAPGSSGVDRIELGAGTYALTIAGAYEDKCDFGDLDIDQDLELVGAGRDVTVIDATGLGDRVLEVLAHAEVSLSDLTITGGSLTGHTLDVPDAEGGGIANAGTLTLERVRVFANEALALSGVLDDDGDGDTEGVDGGHAAGGGIFSAAAGELVLREVEVASNHALGGDGQIECCNAGCEPYSICGVGLGGEALGGGVDARGTLRVEGSRIVQNRAEGGSNPYTAPGGDARGGAIHAGAGADVRSSQLLGNEAVGGQYFGGGGAFGGALYAAAGATRIEQSLIALNLALSPAGGFGVRPAGGGALLVGAAASAEVVNSTFYQNRCIGNLSSGFEGGIGHGGAIAVEGGLSLSTSTLIGNEVQAGDSPGGPEADASGGAIHSSGAVDAVLNLMSDNIAMGRNEPPVPDACGGDPIASIGGNVESPSSTCALAGPGDLSLVPEPDLELGPLAANGGPTATVALGAGSVALDRDAGLDCPDVDQRGAGRIDAACDAGAFELGCDARDLDGDGFAAGGGACGPADCDDADPAVNPGAVEIPGNGIDDDCDPSTPRFGCEASVAADGAEAPAGASHVAWLALAPLALALLRRR